MTKQKIAIAYFVIVTNLFAQWVWQSPVPQGNNLNDVKIINATTAIAVGNLGTVIKSADAGETWNHINLGTEMSFSSIHFADENTGYILGFDGTIFKTTDRSETWTVLSTGIKITYYSICFVSKDVGFVCGYYGYILKTTDGGVTWEKKNSKTINTLNKIYFVNANLGFAVGKEGTVTKTTDGGNTWKGITIDLTSELKSFFFLDENTGWTVSSNGKIFNTTDGGTIWNEQFSNSMTKFSCVWFTDKNSGIAFGSGAFVTNDGGKTWSQVNLIRSIRSVDISKSKLGFAVGERGTIEKTEDGGTTWKTLLNDNWNALRSIFFINKNIGWVGSSFPGGIYKTTNGGSYWELTTFKKSCTKLYFSDENNGFVFGYTAFKTSNSGVKWDTIFPYDSYIRSVAFFEDNIWFVYGKAGIYKSTDNGNNWVWIPVEGIEQWFSIYFVDKQKGWAVTLQGTLIKSVDGGNTWEKQNLVKRFGRQAVYFTDENNGWICGDGGHFSHTTNGGDTWEEQKTGLVVILYSMQFIDKKLGWAVGTGGTILKTTNGGENWIQQKSNTTNDLYTVFFLDENTGWAAGGYGTILKTTNGGTTFIEEEKEIPSEFSLSQNYPNPFNPSTTINYQLSTPGFVTLKVYDVLGREVATLVDEFKQPGVYNSTFSTLRSSLTSGVYFYTLKAGDPSLRSGHGFIQSKKMVLLK
ncbi:MAG: T9SS type A sorting domain-containing protein [Ignavibacteriales bacterium]|nr:T9SS type A sorting domain-containing protein [Ignavibacteriales bacterium]